MMKFVATARDGTKIVCLGLSEENVARLPEAPIVFALEELLPDRPGDVAIVLGAGPIRNAENAKIIAALAGLRGRPPKFLICVSDEVLARAGGAGFVAVPLQEEGLEFMLVRRPTEADMLEEFASLIGRETVSRVDRRVL